MKVLKIEGKPIGTNTYLVVDEETNKAMIIDPSGLITDNILRLSKGYDLVYIINTHGHWDHIIENKKLKDLTNAKLLIHKDDLHKIENPDKNLNIEFQKPDDFLGDKLILGNLKFNVIHTPGHTRGSVCLHEEKEKVIFTGDTLFKRAIGRTDFFDSSENDMKKSLKKLILLPEETIVYPGHGEKTKIKKERKNLEGFLAPLKMR